MSDFLNKIETIGTIIMGVIVILWLLLSIISVFVFKKRHGHLPKGQGYGQD